MVVLGLVCFGGQANASGVTAEDIGTMYIVQSIDEKKKLIKLSDGEIAYNASTIFYNSKGELSSVESIRKGGAITFHFDQNKRFFLRPTATRIWIK